jgi:hypothetical protein
VVERTVGFNVVHPESGAAVDGWEKIEQTVRCRVFTAPEVDSLVGDLVQLLNPVGPIA